MQEAIEKTGLIDLSKKVAIVLEKKHISDVVAQVGFASDVSGSMKDLYRNGVMQNIINRVQALANKFDDNQILDMWAFDSGCKSLTAAVPSMFGTYVNDYIMNRRDIWGGTNYAPALLQVMEHYFPTLEKKAAPVGFLNRIFSKPETTVEETTSTDPVYLGFLTDGENSDKTQTIEILESLVDKRIFIQFIGVGTDSNFEFLKKIATQFSNVDFIDFSYPGKVTDEEMLDKMLSQKFVEWVKKGK